MDLLFTTRLLGALFFTYFAAKLFRKLLANVELPSTARIILAHTLSFGVLAAIAALMKAGVETVREDAALIYIVPQLRWLALDLGAVAKLLRR